MVTLLITRSEHSRESEAAIGNLESQNSKFGVFLIDGLFNHAYHFCSPLWVLKCCDFISLPNFKSLEGRDLVGDGIAMKSEQNSWRETKDQITGTASSSILITISDIQGSKSRHTVANARLSHALAWQA